jgi:hypothetical protein
MERKITDEQVVAALNLLSRNWDGRFTKELVLAALEAAERARPNGP